MQVNICKANMRLEACVRTGEPAHIVESFEQLLQYKVRGEKQRKKNRFGVFRNTHARTTIFFSLHVRGSCYQQ